MWRFRKLIWLLVWPFVWFACSTATKSDYAEALISGIQEKFAPDRRVALFRVDADRQKGTLILRGETTIPEARQALLDSLAGRNISVIDSIMVLPDATVEDKPWGLVTLSVGNMRVEPGHGAEMASQLLLGTPVRILQYRDDWYHVQSPDKYIGWCDGNAIEPMTEAELAAWKKSDRYIYRQVNGFAYAEADNRGRVVSDLVLGDLFTVVSKQKNFLQIQLPDGRMGFVKKSDCLPYSEWKNILPEAGKAIEVASLLMGSPYLWGGTSSKAVDCSGLMKTAWFSQGVILARDASQQARYGEILPVTDPLAFEPGDLLFFGRSKERISHVAMYIGNGRYIHSSGLVRVNSLNPQDSAYSEYNRKRLVSAVRIMNSLNTEEIVQVKEHPWYN